MEERSLVGVLRIAKSKVAPTEDETSEAIYRREQASKLADCILHTYKQNREESDKLIKDPAFLQEVKQVCCSFFPLLTTVTAGYMYLMIKKSFFLRCLTLTSNEGEHQNKNSLTTSRRATKK